MKLIPLTLRDRKLFQGFLGFKEHDLSVYAFQNIYIWRKLFSIRWLIIDDNLCIFFQDKLGCFLFLPPLGREKSPLAVSAAFQVMDSFNKNKEISRLENIEEPELSFYEQLGYECGFKSYDYICLREDLVSLRGDRFKSKRASLNYFTKHYNFTYLPFSLGDAQACMSLYNLWRKQRSRSCQDRLYQGMLQDGLRCLEVLLRDFKSLGLVGRVVKVNGKIKAFSFGYKLNERTFCVLYEITDLDIKGLAQFIFQRFSSELESFKYINIMDDSGLENLKRVKNSYKPVRLAGAYIAKRRNTA